MDYEKNKAELIKAYSHLLELQYYGKEKASNTIKTLCEELLADMLLFRIQEECLNVDVSIGVQLDIIGKYVGIDRYFKGQKYDNKKWLAYYDWNDDTQPNNLQGGYYDWNKITKPNAPYLTYAWILASKNKLGDDDFRALIKLKIIKNNTNMTAKNIDDNVNKLFGDMLQTVWGECMELTYLYPEEMQEVINLAQEKKCLPIPTGVKVNLQVK